jgi:mannose-6-phosphate isomerase-like protein (cupin superfamily)
MNSRKQFIQRSSLGLLSLLAHPLAGLSSRSADFAGLVVNEDDGESFMIRNGTTILKIKIGKTQGSELLCFLSESILPNEGIPVHKHSNEDELIFLHKGSGVFTLGEREFTVKEGSVAIVPKGVWHGLQNTGKENIEMRFAYTPSGFEGYFREVGTPQGQPFIVRSKEEKRAIARKWGMIHKI